MADYSIYCIGNLKRIEEIEEACSHAIPLRKITLLNFQKMVQEQNINHFLSDTNAFTTQCTRTNTAAFQTGYPICIKCNFSVIA